MRGRSKRILWVFLSLACLPSWALEYLSDGELETLDGYTSRTMDYEYDTDGNIYFKRGDRDDCRYGLSDADEQAGLKCEEPFETDQDRLLSEAFTEYLQEVLPMLAPNPKLDTPGDGVQTLDLSVRLEDFDYDHLMCDGNPDAGVIRLEGVSITGMDGGDFRFGPIVNRVEYVRTNTGTRKVLVSEAAAMDGRIGIEAIRIAKRLDDVDNAPSLGGVYITLGESTTRISKYED